MRSVLFSGVVALALVASAHAQAQTAVNIAIGPALQKKAEDIGPREIGYLSDDLRKAVSKAAAASGPNAPTRLDLVLEDAVPNRPTPAQLGRTVGLSLNSIGLGGARISGVATFADGTQRPVHEQYYETDLRDDRGADTWYDADRAIDQIAYDIRRNRYPAKFSGPGPTGSGHFGYPFSDPGE